MQTDRRKQTKREKSLEETRLNLALIIFNVVANIDMNHKDCLHHALNLTPTHSLIAYCTSSISDVYLRRSGEKGTEQVRGKALRLYRC